MKTTIEMPDVLVIAAMIDVPNGSIKIKEPVCKSH